VTDTSAKLSAEVSELVAVSRAVGADLRLVQGGGGNTSVKSADGLTMVVKASGTALAEMTPRRGYRRVDMAAVLNMLGDAALARLPAKERERQALSLLNAATLDNLEGRPSVETCLHALLGRAVVHAHPAAANALCCARDGARLTTKWMDGIAGKPLFMPYVDPGLPLARAVAKAVKRHEKHHGAPPAIIFLANHGVFVTASKASRALAIMRRIDARARAQWRLAAPKSAGPHAVARGGAPQALRDRMRAAALDVWSKDLGAELVPAFSDDAAVRAALAYPDIARLMRVGPLTPDQVVYAHGQPVWLNRPESDAAAMTIALKAAKARLPKTPVTLLVSGVGLFAFGSNEKNAAAALAIASASLLTLVAADAFGGCRGLSSRAVAYLESWEVEEFRRKVMNRS